MTDQSRLILLKIDLACSDFSSELREGNDPSIEDFLETWEGPGRETLFRHLLGCEIDHRESLGEPILAADYLRRFSSFRRIVEDELNRSSDDGVRNPATLNLSITLGKYLILDRLGQGGMGTVFRAQHQRMERMVAVKIMTKVRSGNPESIRRFKREVVASARLVHPNIVTAFDADESDGVHFLVMEFVDGEDFSQLINRVGPLPVAAACEVIRQAAVGLEFAWQHHFVHRDIKPSNLMLSRQGVVKVLDLGLARNTRDSNSSGEEITSTGQVVGTVAYMSPEQATASRDIDIRTDIFSMGATLFKLLSGETLLDRMEESSPTGKLAALALGRYPSAAASLPHLPDGLAEVLDRMLAFRREDRFDSPSEVVDCLEPYCRDHQLAKFATERMPPPVRRENETLSLSDQDMSTDRMLGADFSLSPLLQSDGKSKPTTEARPHTIRTRIATLVAVLVLATASSIWWFAGRDRESNQEQPEAGNPFQANLDAIRDLPLVRLPKAVRFEETWEHGPPFSGDSDSSPGLVTRPRVFAELGKWQIHTRSPQHYTIHDPRITWSPNQKWMTIGERDCTKVYEVETGRLVGMGPNGGVFWSSDSQWISIVYSKQMTFMHPDGTDVFQGVFSSWPVGWSPTANRFAVAGDVLELIDPERRSVRRFPFGRKHRKAKWNADGTWVAVLGDQARVELFEVNAGLQVELGEMGDELAIPPEIDDHYSVTFDWHPQGDKVAFATRNTIQIWTTEGDRLGKYDQFFGAIRYVRWNRAGTRLAVVERNGPIHVLDAKGSRRAVYHPPEESILLIRWINDSRLVARDEAGKLWMFSGQQAQYLGDDPGPELGSVASWNNSDSNVVLGGWRNLKMISFRGADWTTEKIHDSKLKGVIYFPDRAAWSSGNSNEFLACDGEGDTRRYALNQLDRPIKILPRMPHLLATAWSSDGSRFATGSDLGAVQIWTAEGELEKVVAQGKGEVSSLAWHPDNRHVAVYRAGNVFQIWDVIQDKLVTQCELPAEYAFGGCLAFHPKDPGLLGIGTHRQSGLWKWREESKPQTLWDRGTLLVQWNRQGDGFLTAEPPAIKTVRIRKVTSKGRRWRSGVGIQFMDGRYQNRKLKALHRGAVAYSPQGDSILVVASDASVYQLDTDLESDGEARQLKPTVFGVPLSIASSQHREWMAVATFHGIPTLTTDGQPGPPLEDNHLLDANRAVSFSPDGKRIIGIGKHRIAVWDTESRKLLRLTYVLPEHQAVTIGPSGEVLWQTPKAADHLIYSIQDKDGSFRLLSQSAFLKLVN